MNSINIEAENTILIKVIQSETDAFTTNDFIELFLDDGPLAHYKEYVFGITLHNYYLKIFAVNLKKETPDNISEKLLNAFITPQNLKTSAGFSIVIQTSLPQKPLKLVTLFPVPFNITDDQISELTKTWGELVKHDFGRHKRFPTFRNSYLHIHFKSTTPANIPDTIQINDKYITVMIQGEEKIPRCGYCKAKSHTTNDCPVAPPRPQRSGYPGPTTRPRSYANAHYHRNELTCPSPSHQNQNLSSKFQTGPYRPAPYGPDHFPALSQQTSNIQTTNTNNIEKDLKKCAIAPEKQPSKTNNTILINNQPPPSNLSNNSSATTSTLSDESMSEFNGIIPETNPLDLKTSPDFSPFISNLLDEIDMKPQNSETLSYDNDQSNPSESDDTIIEETPQHPRTITPKRKQYSDGSQSSDTNTKPPLKKQNKREIKTKPSSKRQSSPNNRTIK